MLIPPLPGNELQRLASLRALRILDTPPEERFDRITRVAKLFFNAPIIAIGLVDDKRQWFKSTEGLSIRGTSRDVSFCGHAILSRELFIIPDSLLDNRFSDNPLVTGDPWIRFYAGCPLYTLNGCALGSFCIIDHKPRELSTSEQQALRDLGTWVENEINAPEIGQALIQSKRDAGLHAIMENASEVMLHAQTLLYQADKSTRTTQQLYTGHALPESAADESTQRRLALIGALPQAIAGKTLQLFYQPKAEVKTGVVQSAEALARWNHPVYGPIPPDEFIPLAEQVGLIAPLTLWALETALQQCQQWRTTGQEITIAVNLSMWNLSDATLPNTIAAILKSYDLPPSLLRLELTEGAVMTDIHQALEVLNRLVAMGVHIAVDDFGIGYSSLAYLKRLPVDELKIDRTFVQHMATNHADATIVRSTIALAHHLGLQVVAEGVEDKATWDLLAEFGCDIIQGYYLSRPVPATEFEQWLQRRNASSPEDATVLSPA